MVVDSSGPRCGSRVARVWVVSSSYIKHKKEKGKEVLKKMTCACAYVGKPVMWTAKPGKQAQVKLQVKARGSSPTVVYPERARRKPKAQTTPEAQARTRTPKKATTEKKPEKTYTVTSPGEIINVNSHSAIFGLVAIPLGCHLGLAVRSWLGGCLGFGGAGRKEKERKKKKKFRWLGLGGTAAK